MQVLAPAKVNLSLRVLGKRPDGFHEIETLIAPISLYDRIDIEKQNRWIDFVCDDPSVPAGDDNLVVRAAKIFFATTNVKSGVSIKLQKQIPHSAGLGGGSSDAAATLLVLNQLFEMEISRDRLAAIAAPLGSDVPFFVYGSAALCKGRGEMVTPLTLKEKLSILLLKPQFGVASRWAYERWTNSRELPGVDYRAQSCSDLTLVNDLERPVFEKFVFLPQLKMWLRRQPEVRAALMSGSGSTVFAAMREGADVDHLAKRAREELDPETWTCATETL
ncbi:MAG: 4-(cytidine 5'-diphospho)-2-C-methyl-D-erythritol kinase [Verrucomicrobia bacterium]|nr:MAG: 4-(cytidine 5'-diphospho)-2-C-methyl-D-erythritol kinase [Verrucomicrobiota bacterium]